MNNEEFMNIYRVKQNSTRKGSLYILSRNKQTKPNGGSMEVIRFLDSPGLAVKTAEALWYPSVLQSTVPSTVSKLSSHTVPHCPNHITSTLPRVPPPTIRTFAVTRERDI
jgi:hypothetical protein